MLTTCVYYSVLKNTMIIYKYLKIEKKKVKKKDTDLQIHQWNDIMKKHI